MAHDASLYLRQACIARMKLDAPLAAIVGPRVYGPNPVANAEWPFVRMGFPIGTPFLATGIDGSSVEFAVHGFAKGDDETAASLLGVAILGALAEAIIVLNPPFPARAYLAWTGSQIIRDGAEGSSWHAIVQFEATIVS